MYLLLSMVGHLLKPSRKEFISMGASYPAFPPPLSANELAAINVALPTPPWPAAAASPKCCQNSEQKERNCRPKF